MSEFDQYGDRYRETLEQSLGGMGSLDGALKSKLFLLDWLLGDRLRDPAFRMLDLGCGMGLLLNQLLQRSVMVFGADVSRRSLAVSCAPAGLSANCDGGQLGFRDGAFDCAVAACVFHHITAARRAGVLAELRRVLRPQGSVIIIEHNPWNPITRWVVDRCEFDQHAELITRRQLQHTMQENGFRKIRDGYFYTIPPVTRALARVDRMLARLPFGAQYFGMYGIQP